MKISLSSLGISADFMPSAEKRNLKVLLKEFRTDYLKLDESLFLETFP